MSQGSTGTSQGKPIGYMQEITAEGPGKIHHLVGPKALIGRNVSAEIPIISTKVSRNHAVLNYTKKGWTVTDNKSINGVYVNNKRLNPMVPCTLKNGYMVSLGPPIITSFKFEFRLCTESNTRLRSSQEKTGRELREKSNVAVAIPGCSSSSVSPAVGSENLRRSLRKRTIRHDGEASKVSIAKRVCSANNEISLEERLAAFDTRLKFNEEIDQRVKEILNKSDDRLDSKKSECCDQESQSLLPSSQSTVEEALFDNVFTPDSGCISVLLNEPVSGNNPTHSRQKSRKASSSLTDDKELLDLRKKVMALEKQLNEREQAKIDLQKQLEEKEALLDQQKQQRKALEKEEEEKNSKKISEANKAKENLKKEVANQFGELMEAELTCVICTELFVKASTLECSHTFCCKCITVWKRTKKQCPICRAPVKNITKSLVIDNFIDKMVEKLSPEYQERRKNVVKERAIEEKKKSPKKKKGRRTAARSVRRAPSYWSVMPDDDSELDIMPIDNFSLLAENIFTDSILDVDDDDDESSVESYGYYGGYGRCYNCGRPGHWANGCPDV